MKMSKEAKSQQEKFFRACSDSFRRKLTGKEEMTLGAFKEITMILSCLKFEDYYDYVLFRFKDIVDVYGDIVENELNDKVDTDTLLEVQDDILKRFYEGIRSERLRHSYCKLLQI